MSPRACLEINILLAFIETKSRLPECFYNAVYLFQGSFGLAFICCPYEATFTETKTMLCCFTSLQLPFCRPRHTNLIPLDCFPFNT